MVQRYLPEIVSGDKRILVIAGAPVPYRWRASRRAARSAATSPPAAGRGAAAVGARPRDRRDARPHPRRARLLLAGLDVIGDCLTEINVTSPTCFREISDQTGFDVAKTFIDALEAALTSA